MRQEPMQSVRVPPSEGPKGTCWQQWSGRSPWDAYDLGIDPMAHCTREKGHSGPHDWDPAYRKNRLQSRP